MYSFGSVLKRLRKEKKLTQEGLSDILNKKYGTKLNKSMLSKWENDESEPRMDSARFIADFFDVTLDELLGIRENSGFILNEESTIYQVKKTHLSIPHYGNVAAGALSTIEGVCEDEVEFIELPNQLLGKYATSDNLFAMTADGESMNKVIQNGSIVIAKELDKFEYKQGDIVIFEHDGEYSLKRFAPKEIDDFILFKAESTDSSIKNIVIPKDTEQDLKIYGKVVFYSTVLD